MSRISHEYGEGREPIPAIDEPTVIFIINRSLAKGPWTEDELYRATQRSWVIGSRARESAVYALGVKHGVVLGAYRIDRWNPDGHRWCFDGRSAVELNVVGTSIARIKPRQGSSNPVRLFLGGIPPASSGNPE